MEVLLALRAQCHSCIRKNIHLLHHNTGIKSFSHTDPHHMYSITNTATNHQHSVPTQQQPHTQAQAVAVTQVTTGGTVVPSFASVSSSSSSSSSSLWPTFSIFSYFFSSSSSSSSAAVSSPGSSGGVPSALSTDIIQRV
jgi:hypothetical protein